MQVDHRFRAGSALDEESQEEAGNHHGSKIPAISKAERVSSIASANNKAIASKKPKKTGGKGKKTSSGSNAMNLGPLLSASPYHKSIEQMYKNLQSIRKNTGNSAKGNHGKEEDAFLPYLTPFAAPKAPAKVNLDLKTSISHYMDTSTSLAEPSTDAENGFIVASGMVGEEPRYCFSSPHGHEVLDTVR